MPYKLSGRNVLITGASRGLGALLAEKFAKEGCNVAINFNTSEQRAQQVAEKIRSTYNCQAIIIKGVLAPSASASGLQLTRPLQDQGVLAECEDTVQKTIDGLGGLDILVSNAVRLRSQARPTLAERSQYLGLDQNVHIRQPGCLVRGRLGQGSFKGNLHLFRKALPTFNANPEGGVFLLTSSIAGLGPQGSAMAYSVSKAAGLQLMKCLAATQGPKVRINAICPGLLLTDWASAREPTIHTEQNKN
ncbi:MAG: hypothetical protein Q9204_000411 [Flavoplaca sp. TL-2023a]